MTTDQRALAREFCRRHEAVWRAHPSTFPTELRLLDAVENGHDILDAVRDVIHRNARSWLRHPKCFPTELALLDAMELHDGGRVLH